MSGNPYRPVQTPFGVQYSPLANHPGGPQMLATPGDVIVDPVEKDVEETTPIELPRNSHVDEHGTYQLGQQPAYEFDVPRHLS